MAHSNQKPTRTVFVGNIGPDVTEHMLSDMFSPIGALKSIRVVLEKDTGVSKGYAFCAYYDVANAESAIRNLSNREINGRPIRLGYAQDYAFRNEESVAGKGAGAGTAPPQQQQQHQQIPSHPRPQVMLPDHPVHYAPPAAPHAPASMISAPVLAGQQDQISSTLARMSRPELYNILAQMKALIEQNSAQARQILVQNPQLTKALFQAQVILGMVQGAPLQQTSPPNAQPSPHPYLGQPPPQQQQQQQPQQYAAPSQPSLVSTSYANGGQAAAPSSFTGGVHALQSYGAPMQAQQTPVPQQLQQQPGYGQQQTFQQPSSQPPPSYHLQQQGPPPPQQQTQHIQQNQQQPQQVKAAQQYTTPQQQQQQPLQQSQQQPSGAPSIQPQAAQAGMAVDQQRALLEQVMKLTPQQIDLLPPQQKAQVLALQQQMSQFR